MKFIFKLMENNMMGNKLKEFYFEKVGKLTALHPGSSHASRASAIPSRSESVPQVNPSPAQPTPHCNKQQRGHIPANTKQLYNIYTMLDQRRRRWADVVQMLYDFLCLLAFVLIYHVYSKRFSHRILNFHK